MTGHSSWTIAGSAFLGIRRRSRSWSAWALLPAWSQVCSRLARRLGSSRRPFSRRFSCRKPPLPFRSDSPAASSRTSATALWRGRYREGRKDEDRRVQPGRAVGRHLVDARHLRHEGPCRHGDAELARAEADIGHRPRVIGAVLQPCATLTRLPGATAVRAYGAETVTSYAVTDNAGHSIDVSNFLLADAPHLDGFYPAGDNGLPRRSERHALLSARQRRPK